MAEFHEKCCVGGIISLSITAWALSLATTVYCSFVTRVVEIKINGNYTEGLPGPIFDDPLVHLGFSNHGVGFYKWRFFDQCLNYCFDGVCPEFDINFNTAAAMSTLVNVLGGIGVFTLLQQLWLSKKMKYVDFAIFFLGLCLFQGLTLLILRSSICYEPNFFDYIPIIRNITEERIEASDVFCVIERGSKMSIVASVFWFVSAVLSLIQGDPNGSDEC